MACPVLVKLGGVRKIFFHQERPRFCHERTVFHGKLENRAVDGAVDGARLEMRKKDSGWCYTYPSEKYKSQLGVLFPIYGKIKAMFQTTNQLRVQRFCLPPDNITSTILMFMDKSLWFTVVYMLPPRWSGWSLPNMGTVRTGKMGCPFSDQNLKDTVPKSW